MKKYVTILGICLSYFSCLGQNYTFEFTKEQIKEKNILLKTNYNSKEIYSFAGYDDSKLLILHKDSLNNISEILLYDEITDKITKSNITLLQTNKKIVNVKLINNNILIVQGLFNVPDSCKQIPLLKLPFPNFERQDIWAQLEDTAFLSATFPYAYSDKAVEFKLSYNKRYLICNPYYAGIDILANPEDNVIMVYDLTNLNNKIINKSIIPCERCYNTYIINDTLVFGKEFTYTDEFGMDYTYSNIYKAPLYNINASVAISYNTELINMSPDKKYILGKRKLYGKEFSIILDISSQRYQYMTGRKYHWVTSFYSHVKKKFAFDFGNYFIYIDFPNQYPYDAMTLFKPTWKKENEKFWQNYSVIEYERFK
jgi:hypothetical protein